jgi:RNA polymerase sigma factor (sigma-70 family)
MTKGAMSGEAEHPMAHIKFGRTGLKGISKAIKVSTQEEMLLSAARAGQESAFVELCYRHSRHIQFKLFRITKNREDAEDAFQDAILNAFVHFGNFNQASSFTTWLTRISINSALMILRKRRVRPESSIDEPIGESARPLPWEIADRRLNPEQYYIQSEGHWRLRSAISKLPTDYRRVFEIRLRSEGSMKEIAEEVGITIAATKSRLLRARNALHSSIE